MKTTPANATTHNRKLYLHRPSPISMVVFWHSWCAVYRCDLFVNAKKYNHEYCKQRYERATRNGCIAGHRIRRLGAHVPVAGARANSPRQVLL